MPQKNIKKIVLYNVPLLVLALGAFFGLDNLTEIETALSALVSSIFAVLASFGIYSNNEQLSQNK
ncbi:hypothetical protein ATL39_1927 [Sinobaca qinghaiensis]|uniref:Holin n=1 Tax=Sinobaca qinghaiensis TaxID=342944 RepID=A0A419V554_9BACL|nr:hypothetical protein [Sinobaca qinghaiensis]RKD73625.1 hypothetical protein ATL39_1927 [Sinobaca qinghaiensis]